MKLTRRMLSTSCIILFFFPASLPAEAPSVPLPRAHAHNDYLHENPLRDALSHGFCSVEADIFLVNGKLLVAHDPFQLRNSRTLRKLYLDPLRELVTQNKGRVYPNGPPIMLLVDIKTNGEEVYRVLRETLDDYSEILSGFKDGSYRPGAVQIVISGDRPKQSILADKQRLVGIDGRISDLESELPAHALPLISDRWSSHFRWNGNGPFPEAERSKLQEIVAQAHQRGRRVRFWATPETPRVWQELLKAKVDHINTDRLPELAEFLRQNDR